ncbi:tryptophan dimethylallyltransferase family protein [Streptomyces sp. A012304]|uniref:tryptophan dimethylallyltransferase family protein n=1 Tax=Streptomyces sp. A012304 TaxID=375446 RepID=UPI0022324EF0|nr:tryptophan dimethylallyltransferase family protein [Streptomyces sp. A012304]GKQ35261.1 prenyltransferase [Streptomyces sp. A012304]
MIAHRPDSRGLPDDDTVGGRTARQLLRLCEVAGLDPTAAEAYAHTLTEALGPVAERPLDLPPASETFLSDDHTPVEFSLAFVPDAPPTLRVLMEPGSGAGSLKKSGRTGLKILRRLARRWHFTTDPLDDLEDLFFPPSPHGPLALYCALELHPSGVPRVKVYLNPAARGEERSAETVREALRRLGLRRAFATLPEADGYPFFALDLGQWETPRVKVYLRHDGLAAAEAPGLCRMDPGPDAAEIERFFRTAAGLDAETPDADASPSSAFTDDGRGRQRRLTGRPALTCHAFTSTKTERPSGFTLHIPVRAYARDDAEVMSRATTLLGRYGIDPEPLLAASAAVTSRRLEDGVGLIAYLALAHQQGHPPRVTAYVSSEAYQVRPPAALRPAETAR